MPDFGGNLIPDEVFLEILTYTPEQSLASFSLVSRTWHAVVNPILYERITLTWRRTRNLCIRNHLVQHASLCPCEEYAHCNSKTHEQEFPRHQVLRPCLRKVTSLTEHYPSLYLLAKTMIQSPSLASHVRHFRLLGAVPRSVWTDPKQTQLSTDDEYHIRNFLRVGPRTQFREPTWIKELNNGSPSAFAALLLLCLGNLQALEISADFKEPFLFIGILSTVKQLFSHLTTARIGTFRDTVYMAPSRAPLICTTSFDSTLFFYLPSIRQLSLNVPKPLDNPSFQWPIKDTMPLATNLESLELSFTFLSEYDLGRLLTACPRLRMLKYDLWTTCSDYYEQNDGFVDLVALQKALLPVKTTLETFHLHIGKYAWSSGSWNEYFRHISGYMSFYDFPSLLHLHVPLQVLIGDNHDPTIMLGQALPKTLAHLWINDDGFDFPAEDEPGNGPVYRDEEVVGIMLGFLAEWQKYTPSLRALKLLVCQCSYLCWDQWDPEMLANALEPRGNEDLDVSVVMLPYRCATSDNRRTPMEQGPPYFDLDIIEEHRLLKKGENRASDMARLRQRGLL